MKGVAVSLFDYTGSAVRPWADAGYECLCFDLQHDASLWAPKVERFPSGGSITYLHWDSDSDGAVYRIRYAVGTGKVAMVYGFPPCTDLAGSGARHWAKKLAADPLCQVRAVDRAKLCATIADTLEAPYAIENPQGALSRLWRKPDHSFNPCDFGGYIPADDADHPTWPEYIPPRDAYTKRTLLWTGNGFTMPTKRAVEPIVVEFDNGKRGSPQWAKLGGKSMKTKNIRSATPRGFAVAAHAANTGAAL